MHQLGMGKQKNQRCLWIIQMAFKFIFTWDWLYVGIWIRQSQKRKFILNICMRSKNWYLTNIYSNKTVDRLSDILIDWNRIGWFLLLSSFWPTSAYTNEKNIVSSYDWRRLYAGHLSWMWIYLGILPLAVRS